MSENTQIFDNVFRTMVTKFPELVVPLVNEVFSTAYTVDDLRMDRRNEFFKDNRGDDEIITDSIFLIGDKLYHIECQSTNDRTMVIRMVQYDFQIAFESIEKDIIPPVIQLPQSCVLYIRKNDAIPAELHAILRAPDGQEMNYRVPTINVQDFTQDEIFEKDLLMFLPYYILRYEPRLDTIEKDSDQIRHLADDMQVLCERLLQEPLISRRAGMYNDLIALMQRVSDHVLRKQQTTMEEVEKVMGGQVLELPSDAIREEGRREGREEGEGIGYSNACANLTQTLTHSLLAEHPDWSAAKAEREARRMLHIEE